MEWSFRGSIQTRTPCECDLKGRRMPRYLFLEVWPARQARNAAAACSRSSALLSRRRGCLFAGGVTMGVPPLTSSTPRRRIRLRLAMRDQFTRPDITHFLATRALYSKAAGETTKTGGFALAPQTMPPLFTSGIVGAVEPECSDT